MQNGGTELKTLKDWEEFKHQVVQSQKAAAQKALEQKLRGILISWGIFESYFLDDAMERLVKQLPNIEYWDNGKIKGISVYYLTEVCGKRITSGYTLLENVEDLVNFFKNCKNQ
jgi:hypothetical protein